MTIQATCTYGATFMANSTLAGKRVNCANSPLFFGGSRPLGSNYLFRWQIAAPEDLRHEGFSGGSGGILRSNSTIA